MAFSHQNAKYDPIIKACSARTTFGGLIHHIADVLREKQHASDTNVKVGYTLPKLLGAAQLEVKRAKHKLDQPEPDEIDLNDAITLLANASACRRGNTVVVIDEFDQITKESERTQFADFIKQIGDQQLGVCFIFCGVADSPGKLLGAHQSAHKYIEGIQVLPLSWDARLSIVDDAADALGVKVGQHPRFRIAAISDGFPQYVHSVSEKLFWEMFRDTHSRLEPTQEHYHNAVNSAVLAMEQHLKTAYDAATMKATDDYEDVLWAMADHPELIRSIDSLFESYEQIMNQLEQEPMGRSEFTGKSASATSQNPVGSYWRVTGERSIVFATCKGIVRLRAEDHGLELALDYYSASSASAASTWTARGARRAAVG